MKGRASVVAALVLLGPLAAGAKGQPQLVVTQAVVNIDQNTLTIHGTNFLKKGDEPVHVWLAETELALILPPLPSEVLVGLPPDLALVRTS